MPGKVYGIEDLITLNHLEKMNIIILLTGSMVGFAYITEFFMAWYSQVGYEQYAFINRATGPYAWAYWIMMSCNLIAPQVFWFKRLRRSVPLMFAISILVNVGMWFERFVITVVSLHRDYLPSSWGYFTPTWVDVMTFVGSLGLFLTLFLLFLRFAPMVALSEVKGVCAAGRSAFSRPGIVMKKILAEIKASMGIYESEPVHGLLAEFADPGALLDAAAQVREAGYRHFDVHSPFPIHGMDKAMGLGNSLVGCFFTLGGGITGFALGYWLQWWTGAVAYPLNISGKPFFAIEPSIPIIFELTVLFAAFGAVAGMFALNGLPAPS